MVLKSLLKKKKKNILEMADNNLGITGFERHATVPNKQMMTKGTNRRASLLITRDMEQTKTKATREREGAKILRVR
jgi:hypothetical protein